MNRGGGVGGVGGVISGSIDLSSGSSCLLEEHLDASYSCGSSGRWLVVVEGALYRG
jgi:hypothetical protein